MANCKRDIAGAALLFALALTTAAFAQDGTTIRIDDPRWERLSKSEQDTLIQKLTAGGVLGKNDKVVYVPPKTAGPVEKDTYGTALFAPIGALICGKKFNANLEKCSELSGSAAKKCRDETKVSAKKSKGICGG